MEDNIHQAATWLSMQPAGSVIPLIDTIKGKFKLTTFEATKAITQAQLLRSGAGNGEKKRQ